MAAGTLKDELDRLFSPPAGEEERRNKTRQDETREGKRKSNM